MPRFIVEPHFRLQEWVAEEKGYFRAEGLDYEFRELIRSTGGQHHNKGAQGAFQSIEQGREADVSCACHFRALKSAQRDIDLRPERYTHYYRNEFPDRFHAQMDTRRWGPGERLVFERYTKEAYDQSFEWIAQHGIFAEGRMGAGDYDKATVSFHPG